MTDWCKSVSELDNFLAFVLLYGPDRFPPQRDMNIKKAFLEINAGINYCADEIDSAKKIEKLKTLSKKSEDNFKTGNEVEAAHMIQEMSELLIAKRS